MNPGGYFMQGRINGQHKHPQCAEESVKMPEIDGCDDDMTVWSILMEEHIYLKNGAATILVSHFGHGTASEGMESKI
eukprot:2294964-Amphidinium_carterae.4